MWFPMFLKRLKAVLNFLRSDVNMKEVCRCLERDGFEPVAQMIRKTKLPTFAAWRWGKLDQVCKALGGFLETLVMRFDAVPFQSIRDQKEFGLVLSAFRSADWHVQFEFVKEFCNWLNRLQSWVGGCDCHEEQLQAGEEICCHMKGRRLPSAWAFAKDHLDSGLRHTNDMTAGRFRGDYKLLSQAQGCVRMVHALGLEKLQLRDQVPYLVARLRQPGVRARVVQQWGSASPESHHRLTRKICQPGGDLRAHLDAVTEDGRNLSPSLEEVVRSLELAPMDDTVCEQPHAAAKKISGAASGSKFPWVASSLRLEQNLDDCRQLPRTLSMSLDGPWSKFKTVIQPARKETLAPKLKHRAFEKRLYSCDHLVGFSEEGGVGQQLPGERRGDDHGDVPPAGHGAVEDPGGPHVLAEGVAAVAAAPHPDRHSQGTLLLRQLFAATLRSHDLVSVPTQDAEVPLLVFQLLDVERRNIAMKPFITDQERQTMEGLFMSTIQELEVWGSHGEELLDKTELEFFVVSDPRKADLIAAFGPRVGRWKDIKVWQSRQSDLEGCLTLHSPSSLGDRRKPSLDSNIPVLQLLDILKEAGFTAANRDAVHTPDADLVFCGRAPAGRRCYYQCLLVRGKLWEKGVTAFDSKGSQAYYKALLGCKGAVHQGLSAATYRQMLLRDQADPSALSLHAKPDLVLPAVPPSPTCSSIAGDEGSVQGGVSDADASDISGDGPAGHEGEDIHRPADILGQQVFVVQGRRTTTHTYEARLRVSCSNPAHGHCERSRSVALYRAELGHHCAEAFLGAWLRKAVDLPAVEHRKYTPSLADMQTYLHECS